MSAAHTDSLPRGTRIGDCVLHRLAGSGGQSQVYLAWDINRQCPAALKLFRLGSEQTPSGTTEPALRAAQLLRHPHIVAVYAVGHHRRQDWMSMEWVPGHDLSHYLEPRWQLPASWALSTLKALALALAHAHRHGVVHRDLKPANVRIHLPTAQIKLADFGIAASGGHGHSATGVIKGTPAYMAPESLAGEACGTPADLYALGVLGFELLTRRRPHEADRLGQLLQDIHHRDAPRLRSLRPDLPESLDLLFASLLARRPDDRPPDAQAVADALHAASLELAAASALLIQAQPPQDGDRQRLALPEAQ